MSCALRFPRSPGRRNSQVLMISEIVIGVSIGLLSRLFFLALQFMAVAVASHVGLSGMLGPSVDEPGSVPAVSSLITLSATTLFFITDLHWEVFRGIFASYHALPVAGAINIAFQPVQDGRRAFASYASSVANYEPAHNIFNRHKFHVWHLEQAHAADTGVFHIHALRYRRWHVDTVLLDRRVPEDIHSGSWPDIGAWVNDQRTPAKDKADCSRTWAAAECCRSGDGGASRKMPVTLETAQKKILEDFDNIELLQGLFCIGHGAADEVFIAKNICQ